MSVGQTILNNELSNTFYRLRYGNFLDYALHYLPINPLYLLLYQLMLRKIPFSKGIK